LFFDPEFKLFASMMVGSTGLIAAGSKLACFKA